MTDVASNPTVPAIISRVTPAFSTRKPANRDGTYMARTWARMTPLVSSSEKPSFRCILNGVAVMINVMTP